MIKVDFNGAPPLEFVEWCMEDRESQVESSETITDIMKVENRPLNSSNEEFMVERFNKKINNTTKYQIILNEKLENSHVIDGSATGLENPLFRLHFSREVLQPLTIKNLVVDTVIVSGRSIKKLIFADCQISKINVSDNTYSNSFSFRNTRQHGCSSVE